MLKMRIGRSEGRRWGASRGLLLSALVAAGIWAGSVQAQGLTTCTRVKELTTDSAWNMQPSGTVFKNGDVVGWVNASTQYYLPISEGHTVLLMAQGKASSNAFDAEPLIGMPGLGLRIRWGGYSATSTLTPVAPGAAAGTVISNRTWFSILNARTQNTYILTEKFKFELVVIDDKLYKGGKLTFTESGLVTFATSNQIGENRYQACVNGWIDAMTALTGSVQVPELPEPVQPTCKFDIGSLNQRVSLGPVDPGQVAAHDTPRSAGQEGQARFSIRASACNQGTVMHMYFTDSRSGSSTADYLSSSKDAVGVRLYFSDETRPLSFGPAPQGSTLPMRPAITVGPVPQENVGVSMDFTAQYVRRPNTKPQDVTPGAVQAETTFTIIYP